jgi:hypothetical protein
MLPQWYQDYGLSRCDAVWFSRWETWEEPAVYISSTMKMEADFSEKLVAIYQTTRSHITEDHNLVQVNDDYITVQRQKKKKMKLSLSLIKHHAMKTCGGAEV